MTGNTDIIGRYLAHFARLTPENLDELDAVCAPDVRFVDPFNDVTGINAFKHVLAEMFETLDAPAFRIDDRADGAHASYVRWTFTARLKGGKSLTIAGMSELHTDADGSVSAHIDHWDAAGQLYEKLPVVGAFMRWLRRRVAA
ncbi:SnoaL-like domain-containing protein [Limimonas halophila]|uniref:SnoaL-like domain-containing protein n=1 Tax=Limimonas halophila TaxID=1082479 RepID=A0A1G7NY69_9PROT|nr:nuclear transport factor 2 family protein [Limimonas halophila]SDF79016.1 SnoaL-like domain-containing protein [Limimonas halophila]